MYTPIGGSVFRQIDRSISPICIGDSLVGWVAQVRVRISYMGPCVFGSAERRRRDGAICRPLLTIAKSWLRRRYKISGHLHSPLGIAPRSAETTFADHGVGWVAVVVVRALWPTAMSRLRCCTRVSSIGGMAIKNTAP